MENPYILIFLIHSLACSIKTYFACLMLIRNWIDIPERSSVKVTEAKLRRVLDKQIIFFSRNSLISFHDTYESLLYSDR